MNLFARFSQRHNWLEIHFLLLSKNVLTLGYENAW